MSKALFRWLRGEFNGYYITRINSVMNRSAELFKQFFVEFSSLQFNLEEMPNEMIYNLGHFAGIFLPRLSVGEGYGAMRMTESHVVDGNEYSERGLFMRDSESFEFIRTDEEEYDTDINTEATQDARSGMVEDGKDSEGYIPYNETDVIDENGNVRDSKVIPTTQPVPTVPYGDFYGNEYMFLSEMISNLQEIPVETYYLLIISIQEMRYNGINISSLCNIINAICPSGFILIEGITKNPSRSVLDLAYMVDWDMTIDRPTERVRTFLFVIEKMFPQINAVEVIL